MQTTFLPKNNQLDPKERGYVRASKGRVFGTRPENGPNPPAPPEPEFEPPTLVTKAMFSELNWYEVGREMEAFSATWQGGNPENQVYRSRWQYRPTVDDSWENTSWTNHINQQVKFSTEITRPGIHRFNTQIRDSTVDPIYQSNQFSQSKTAVEAPPPPPPTTIGTVSATVDGANYPMDGTSPVQTLNGNTLALATAITGDASPSYSWSVKQGSANLVGNGSSISATINSAAPASVQIQCDIIDANATDNPFSFRFFIVVGE